MSRLFHCCIVSVCLAGIGACARAPESRRAARIAPTCTEVSGEATMANAKRARRAAAVNLFHRIDDSRGFLAANGHPHVAESGRRTRCSAYPLWPELNRCVVTAKVCGHS